MNLSYKVYFVSGILGSVKGHFDIGDDLAGLLQTAFVLSYMLFAPIFGYLGDRYNRRYIMAFGVFLWSLTTMAGSFMNVGPTEVEKTLDTYHRRLSRIYFCSLDVPVILILSYVGGHR